MVDFAIMDGLSGGRINGGGKHSALEVEKNGSLNGRVDLDR
jgi:hypothetical protein